MYVYVRRTHADVRLSAGTMSRATVKYEALFFSLEETQSSVHFLPQPYRGPTPLQARQVLRIAIEPQLTSAELQMSLPFQSEHSLPGSRPGHRVWARFTEMTLLPFG